MIYNRCYKRFHFWRTSMLPYCDYCIRHPEDTFNSDYHHTQYGFPLRDDALLFERLMFEINQAGLSWMTILKKADNFRRAYDNFDIDAIAAYGEADQARLLADPGIIRNRLKVEAAVDNARTLLRLRESHEMGHVVNYAWRLYDEEEWVKLFKRTFRFTGGEIVGEFLMSTGWLPGAHQESCPVYRKVLRARPMWAGTDGKREKGSGKR